MRLRKTHLYNELALTFSAPSTTDEIQSYCKTPNACIDTGITKHPLYHRVHTIFHKSLKQNNANVVTKEHSFLIHSAEGWVVIVASTCPETDKEGTFVSTLHIQSALLL